MIPINTSQNNFARFSLKQSTDMNDKKSDENVVKIKLPSEVNSKSLENLESEKNGWRRERSSNFITELSGSLPEIKRSNSIVILDEETPAASDERLMRVISFETPQKRDSYHKCTDICRKKECLDSRIRLPPIKRTESQDLAFDIQAICEQIPLNENSIPAINIVNSKRKEKHENIIKEITLRMDDVNQSIETEIRTQAQHLLSNIHLIRDNVEKILSSIRPKSYDQSHTSLSETMIHRIQEIIIQLNENRISRIKSYCDYLWGIESERTESFKTILKKAYSEMHTVMYILPKYIQKFFEEKIEHLNEVTMNNYHCYIDLEESLKLQMEEELKSWFLKLRLLSEEKILVENSSITDHESDTNIQDNRMKKMNIDMKKDIKEKIDFAMQAVDEFQTIMEESLFLKTHPIIKLIRDYSYEIQKAGLNIIDAGLVNENGLTFDIQAMKDISAMHNIDEDELQKLWMEDITAILKVFNDNLKVLYNSTKLFDCFCDRSNELNFFYMQQLFVMVAKNDKTTMKTNNEMNLLIDKLRQAPSEDQLNKTLDEIESAISGIDLLIQSHLKDELSLVDKYQQLGLMSADVLIDELGRFVKEFVPPSDRDPRTMKKRASWMDVEELKTNDHLFTKEILHCRYVLQNIDNWQFGVWHTILTMMDLVKEIISKNLTEWAKKVKEIIMFRSDLKMKINNNRMKCIKADFWEVRLDELILHNSRVDEQESALKEEVTKLITSKKQFEITCNNIVSDKYQQDIEDAIKAHNQVERKMNIQKLMRNLNNLNSTMKDELEDEYLKFISSCAEIWNDMANSHITFLKSIRFFHENGNFNIDEFKRFIKKLLSTEKIIIKQFSSQKEYQLIANFFIEECDKRFKSPQHILNKRIDEIDFAEDVNKRMKKLHSSLIDGIFNIKCDMRNLDAKIRSLKEASYTEENLGSYDWLFSFSKCYKELLNEFDSFKEHFFFNESSAPDENFLHHRKDNSKVSITSTPVSKTKKITNETNKAGSQKKEEKRRTFKSNPNTNKSKNYTSLLYPTSPLENGGYLSGLAYKIYQSFCEIQEVARNFYDTHGEVLDQGRLAPDLKAFAMEIINTYKYYHLQIEFFWMDCLIKFIEQLKNFRKFLENYYNDTLQKYFKNRDRKLTEKTEKILKDLEDNLRTIEDYYIMLHKRVKPMFGHPKMTKMLEVIDSHMKQAEEFSNQNLLDFLESKKEILKAHCINTESLLLDMDNILSNIKGDTTISMIHNELQMLMSNKMRRLKNIVSVDQDGSSSKHHLKMSHSKSMNQLDKLRQKVMIPPEVEISYSKILGSIEDVSFAEVVDTKEMVISNMDKYKLYCMKIDTFQEKCYKIHQKYQQMWIQDVEKISKLFEIKYNYTETE